MIVIYSLFLLLQLPVLTGYVAADILINHVKSPQHPSVLIVNETAVQQKQGVAFSYNVRAYWVQKYLFQDPSRDWMFYSDLNKSTWIERRPPLSESYSIKSINYAQAEPGQALILKFSAPCILSNVSMQGVVLSSSTRSDACVNSLTLLVNNPGRKRYRYDIISSDDVTVDLAVINCTYIVPKELKNELSCWVGDLTTFSTMQCHCGQLITEQLADVSLVTPNPIDVDAVPPISDVIDNPIVISMCIGLWVLLIPLSYYAYKRSIEDEKMMKVVQLAENKPDDRFAYLVTVVTGWRPGAGTTAKVGLKLFGERGKSCREMQSQGSRLWDPDTQRFQAGGEDSFLLTTKSALGRLTKVEIWHDNTGSSPHWFLSCVVVLDLRTNKVWKFVHHDWICAVKDEGPMTLARATLMVTSPQQLTTMYKFRFMFNLAKMIRDGHLFVSIFTRPPSETFTRVQRLVCFFTVLQMMMLFNIIFFGKNEEKSEQIVKVGSFSISLSKIIIGIEVGLISVPIQFIMVMLFKRSRPSSSTMARIRARTDWHRDTGVIIGDQEYDYDLEQMKIDVAIPSFNKKGKNLGRMSKAQRASKVMKKMAERTTKKKAGKRGSQTPPKAYGRRVSPKLSKKNNARNQKKPVNMVTPEPSGKQTSKWGNDAISKSVVRKSDETKKASVVKKTPGPTTPAMRHSIKHSGEKHNRNHNATMTPSLALYQPTSTSKDWKNGGSSQTNTLKAYDVGTRSNVTNQRINRGGSLLELSSTSLQVHPNWPRTSYFSRTENSQSNNSKNKNSPYTFRTRNAQHDNVRTGNSRLSLSLRHRSNLSHAISFKLRKLGYELSPSDQGANMSSKFPSLPLISSGMKLNPKTEKAMGLCPKNRKSQETKKHPQSKASVSVEPRTCAGRVVTINPSPHQNQCKLHVALQEINDGCESSRLKATLELSGAAGDQRAILDGVPVSSLSQLITCAVQLEQHDSLGVTVTSDKIPPNWFDRIPSEIPQTLEQKPRNDFAIRHTNLVARTGPPILPYESAVDMQILASCGVPHSNLPTSVFTQKAFPHGAKMNGALGPVAVKRLQQKRLVHNNFITFDEFAQKIESAPVILKKKKVNSVKRLVRQHPLNVGLPHRARIPKAPTELATNSMLDRNFSPLGRIEPYVSTFNASLTRPGCKANKISFQNLVLNLKYRLRPVHQRLQPYHLPGRLHKIMRMGEMWGDKGVCVSKPKGVIKSKSLSFVGEKKSKWTVKHRLSMTERMLMLSFIADGSVLDDVVNLLLTNPPEFTVSPRPRNAPSPISPTNVNMQIGPRKGQISKDLMENCLSASSRSKSNLADYRNLSPGDTKKSLGETILPIESAADMPIQTSCGLSASSLLVSVSAHKNFAHGTKLEGVLGPVAIRLPHQPCEVRNDFITFDEFIQKVKSTPIILRKKKANGVKRLVRQRPLHIGLPQRTRMLKALTVSSTSSISAPNYTRQGRIESYVSTINADVTHPESRANEVSLQNRVLRFKCRPKPLAQRFQPYHLPNRLHKIMTISKIQEFKEVNNADKKGVIRSKSLSLIGKKTSKKTVKCRLSRTERMLMLAFINERSALDDVVNLLQCDSPKFTVSLTPRNAPSLIDAMDDRVRIRPREIAADLKKDCTPASPKNKSLLTDHKNILSGDPKESPSGANCGKSLLFISPKVDSLPADSEKNSKCLNNCAMPVSDLPVAVSIGKMPSCGSASSLPSKAEKVPITLCGEPNHQQGKPRNNLVAIFDKFLRKIKGAPVLLKTGKPNDGNTTIRRGSFSNNLPKQTYSDSKIQSLDLPPTSSISYSHNLKDVLCRTKSDSALLNQNQCQGQNISYFQPIATSHSHPVQKSHTSLQKSHTSLQKSHTSLQKSHTSLKSLSTKFKEKIKSVTKSIQPLHKQVADVFFRTVQPSREKVFPHSTCSVSTKAGWPSIFEFSKPTQPSPKAVINIARNFKKKASSYPTVTYYSSRKLLEMMEIDTARKLNDVNPSKENIINGDSGQVTTDLPSTCSIRQSERIPAPSISTEEPLSTGSTQIDGLSSPKDVLILPHIDEHNTNTVLSNKSAVGTQEQASINHFKNLESALVTFIGGPGHKQRKICNKLNAISDTCSRKVKNALVQLKKKRANTVKRIVRRRPLIETRKLPCYSLKMHRPCTHRWTGSEDNLFGQHKSQDQNPPCVKLNSRRNSPIVPSNDSMTASLDDVSMSYMKEMKTSINTNNNAIEDEVNSAPDVWGKTGDIDPEVFDERDTRSAYEYNQRLHGIISGNHAVGGKSSKGYETKNLRKGQTFFGEEEPYVPDKRQRLRSMAFHSERVIRRRSDKDVGVDAPPGVTYDPLYYWFPSWGAIIGWLLAFTLSIISTTVTIVYGVTYGYEKSADWALNMAVSFLQLFVISHPLKILAWTCLSVLCCGSELATVAQGLVCAHKGEKKENV